MSRTVPAQRINALDRDLSGRFGSDKYAMEELVAELTSAFLCGTFGIEGGLQHPEYIANWLKVLNGDKYAVFKAASLAQAASDFILAGGIAKENVGDEPGASESDTTAQAA